MTLRELVREWQSEALQLRSRYGQESLAKLCETHAVELEEALREAEDEQLTLSEASKESGYSKRRLRELVADGVVPNVGRKGSPRIRRADLPRKPRAGGPSDQFDVRAHSAPAV